METNQLSPLCPSSFLTTQKKTRQVMQKNNVVLSGVRIMEEVGAIPFNRMISTEYGRRR